MRSSSGQSDLAVAPLVTVFPCIPLSAPPPAHAHAEQLLSQERPCALDCWVTFHGRTLISWEAQHSGQLIAKGGTLGWRSVAGRVFTAFGQVAATLSLTSSKPCRRWGREARAHRSRTPRGWTGSVALEAAEGMLGVWVRLCAISRTRGADLKCGLPWHRDTVLSCSREKCSVTLRSVLTDNTSFIFPSMFYI